MICCDKCDDWFHGKCVGVTKAQAQQMEKRHIQWHCPNCKKLIKQEQVAQGKVRPGPGRPSSRRGSEASVSPRGVGDSKSQRGSVDIRSPSSDTPKRRDSVGPGRRRKTDSSSIDAEENLFSGKRCSGPRPG